MTRKAKIPTILGILVLVIGIAAGVFLVQSRQIFRLRASPETTPKDIRTTNITDTSFTVSWTTDKQVQGFIKWGENAQSLDKTKTSSNPAGDVHSITLNGFSPSTTYYFLINSDGKDYDNEGIPWQVKTGPNLSVPPKSIIISGSILTQSGTPAANVLVYASVGGGSMLSATTNENGSWVIPISSAKTQDLGSYININETSTLIELSVQAGSLGVASAQIYPSSAKPAPDISLGEVYDFKNLPPSKITDSPEAQIPLPDDTEKASGFDIPADDSTEEGAVTLESVKSGEVILDTQPEFFGEGPPGTEITITIESEPQTDSIEVDNDGAWSWSPPDGLGVGSHTITISWYDAEGLLKTLTRSFVVSAQEGPAFIATPSATPTLSVPTPTLRVTPTSTPSPSPTDAATTGTPTITPTNTPTPSPTATLTPRPTRSATDSGLPDAGAPMPTILLSILALGSILFGGLLYSYSPRKK